MQLRFLRRVISGIALVRGVARVRLILVLAVVRRFPDLRARAEKRGQHQDSDEQGQQSFLFILFPLYFLCGNCIPVYAL